MYKKGFTLIELLVVVAIIGILASVVLASLNSASSKGKDAGVKSNLASGMKQAEIFYITNSAVINSYTNICTNGTVGGVIAAGSFITAAAKASGLSGSPNYATNATGTTTTATCNQSANAWAAEVPLKTGTNQMWCVDSMGKSKQETGTSLDTAPAGSDYTCI